MINQIKVYNTFAPSFSPPKLFLLLSLQLPEHERFNENRKDQ